MKKIVYLVFSVFLFSCGDFLQEFSQDLAYARNCKDLDELLIGNGYMASNNQAMGVYSAYYAYLQMMDDDVSVDFYGAGIEKQDRTLGYKNFYTWSNQLTINPTDGEEWKDADWKRIYEHIGYLNVIIGKIKDFTRDSAFLRDRVEGEARFLRGAYYYLLANLYANPYVKETATTDLGIPLNLTEDIEDKYFTRNSMEQTYAAIVNDLVIAADKLKGVTQENFYRVEEASTRILLSRVYLYMGEWQLAMNECEKIAQMRMAKRELRDVNTWNKYVNNVRHGWLDTRNGKVPDNPEVLFTQGNPLMGGFDVSMNGQSNNIGGRFCASQELIDLYSKYENEGVEDMRLWAYFELMASKMNYFPFKISMMFQKVFDNFVIRTSEYYLNRAEAAAMLEQPGVAIEALKTLMVNRFKDGKIPDINGLSGEALIKFIREERRRELCFECQRWFDLRRYAVYPKYPEKKSITHPIYSFAAEGTMGVYEGSYTLKPYGEDPAWVLPIPSYEIVYNQGALVDNPQREKRELDK